jgi:thiol-disulfide isomerase/thioredoxin
LVVTALQASQSLLATLLGLLLLALIKGCDEAPPTLTQGQALPGFSLEQLQEGSMSFPQDLQGKVVAIRFWADWCPFCKTEMRDIEPIYQQYRERGLVILAVNVRQDRATAARFIRRLDISYPVLLDVDGAVARRYGVKGLPTTFIADRAGKLHTKILGESTPELFEQILRELL